MRYIIVTEHFLLLSSHKKLLTIARRNFAKILFFYQILNIVKKKIASTLVGLMLLMGSTAMAQNYLATKTLLDSVKVNKLHGTAQALIKVEQTDAFKVEVDVMTELIYAFNKHKLRFSGNIAYNMINKVDNGNKGFFYLGGDFFQFNIQDKKREKTKQFFSTFVSYQYDYCRDLHDRAMVGVTTTWQPLREDPHMFVEPSVGLMAGMQYWNVIKDPTNLECYNNHVSPELKEYLGIDPSGRKMQWDTRLLLSCHFGGEWDRISVNAFAMVAQPLWRPFTANEEMEAQLGELDQQRDKVHLTEGTPSIKGCLNTNPLPLITANCAFKVRIWNKLYSVTSVEFLWDGGEVPSYARNLTYCFTQGLSYSW